MVDAFGKSDSSETDSALGESVAGSQYTTSLASSVLNYQYENGRRYHAYCRGRYILPNDEVEQERLDILHHIFKMICGGAIFRVPLFTHMRPQRVLDMGCGTGIWAIEFADDWPETTVIGTDLSPIQPSWIPPNCKFYVDDIEGEWTYPAAEHFDYIHGRALHGSIGDWRGLFSKAFNHLKPGGFLEIQDFRGGIGSDDDGMRHVPYLADWVEKVGEGMRMMGRAGKMAHLKGYMEELGFVDIHEETCKVRRKTNSSQLHNQLLNYARSQSGRGQRDRKIKILEYSGKHMLWLPSNLIPWLYLRDYLVTARRKYMQLLHE